MNFVKRYPKTCAFVVVCGTGLIYYFRKEISLHEIISKVKSLKNKSDAAKLGPSKSDLNQSASNESSPGISPSASTSTTSTSTSAEMKADYALLKTVNNFLPSKIIVLHVLGFALAVACYSAVWHCHHREKTDKIFGGLRNNSNFCYMNSMIQALASNGTFLKELRAIDKENSKQLKNFIKLLDKINSPESNAIENTDKLDKLMSKINWTKPDQQDAFDLLAFLINSIEKSIKLHKETLMPLKLQLMHTFSGINIPDKSQNHLGLSIGLCGSYNKHPGVSLNYLIEEHFSPTFIDNDSEKTTTLKFYNKLPNVLLLHIQANKWNSERGEMVKPEYHIQYKENLEFDAERYIEHNKFESEHVKYNLTAIVHHMGNISGGHYITYRKWKGQWYLVNDEQVTFVDFKCDVCPYILIYEKS